MSDNVQPASATPGSLTDNGAPATTDTQPHRARLQQPGLHPLHVKHNNSDRLTQHSSRRLLHVAMVLGLLAGVPKQVCLNAGADWHGRLLRRSGIALMLTSNVMALMNLAAPELFFKRGCMGPVAVSSFCVAGGTQGVWREGAGGKHGVWIERGQVARTECGWRDGAGVTHGVWRERGGRWHPRSVDG